MLNLQRSLVFIECKIFQMIQTFWFVRFGEGEMCTAVTWPENDRSVVGGGRRWWRQESGLQIFWKNDRESLSRWFFNEFKLATNNTNNMTFHGYNGR